MIKLSNIDYRLSKGGVIVNDLIYDGKAFEKYTIYKDLPVELSSGEVIIIPKGFKHDKNSILKVIAPILFLISFLIILNSIKPVMILSITYGILVVLMGILLYRAYGTSDIAAIIHDYLYSRGYRDNSRMHRLARNKRYQADKEFYLWLKATHNTNLLNRISIYLMYLGVRSVGWIVY